MKNRERNYDLLRSVCAVMVVVLHAAAFYQHSDISQYSNIGIFWQGVTRTAVPCFIMLSGAFLLSDERWKSYQFAIKKTIKVIMIPTLIYSIIFIGISFLTYYMGISDASYKEVLVLAAKGFPYPHMWYMFVCLGLYSITPLLWRLKMKVQSFGEIKYIVFVIILLIIGSVVQSAGELFWMVRVPTLVGYFMIGDCIRRYYIDKESKPSGVALLVWISVILFSCFIQIYTLDWSFWDYSHTNPLNPLVIVASISCFVFFSSINVKWDTYQFAKHTSRIYFVHIIPLQIIKVMMERFVGSLIVPIIGIPIMVLGAIVCSVIYSLIVNKIKHQLNIRFKKMERKNMYEHS